MVFRIYPLWGQLIRSPYEVPMTMKSIRTPYEVPTKLIVEITHMEYTAEIQIRRDAFCFWIPRKESAQFKSSSDKSARDVSCPFTKDHTDGQRDNSSPVSDSALARESAPKQVETPGGAIYHSHSHPAVFQPPPCLAHQPSDQHFQRLSFSSDRLPLIVGDLTL